MPDQKSAQAMTTIAQTVERLVNPKGKPRAWGFVVACWPAGLVPSAASINWIGNAKPNDAAYALRILADRIDPRPVPAPPAPELVMSLDYTNHRGERAWRQVRPLRVHRAESEYHPGAARPILYAIDVERQVEREFLCSSIHAWRFDEFEAPADQARERQLEARGGMQEELHDCYGGKVDTPAARWRDKGEPDPHGDQFDGPRSSLLMGDKTDDELANAVYLYDHRRGLESLLYLQAAKDRIRWLSRRVVALERQVEELGEVEADREPDHLAGEPVEPESR